MTEHVSIELDEDELARARLAAEASGVAIEVYLRTLIVAHLPTTDAHTKQQFYLSKIFGMGSTAEPTDIAKDKDRLIGEAVWEEYLRKTKQK
jgi:hypothetical protein